jgi:hypothetical protein
MNVLIVFYCRLIIRDVAIGKMDNNTLDMGNIKLDEIPTRALVHYDLEIYGRAVRPQTIQSFIIRPAPELLANFKVAFTSCVNHIRVPIQLI